MRKSILELTTRNFGFKIDNTENLSDHEKIVQNNIIEFITEERKTIYNILRKISSNIVCANKIYPTIMSEYEERRLYQDRAISLCYDLQAELQFCMESLPNIDMNGFLRYSKDIGLQINLLKGWRKSDNKIKSTISKTDSNINTNKIEMLLEQIKNRLSPFYPF